MDDGQFRFENMEIWRRGADLSGRLFVLAEQLDQRKFFRFAEQLRPRYLEHYEQYRRRLGKRVRYGLWNFLNTARRSVFEVANMLLLLSRQKYLTSAEIASLLNDLAEESRMIHAFRRSLKS